MSIRVTTRKILFLNPKTRIINCQLRQLNFEKGISKMKERSSYQRQVLLAIIPIIGILVVWQLVCNNMMKVTKNYWYIFLAYLFCIILLSFIGGIVYITIICLHIDLENLQNKIFIAAMLGIIASIVIAMSFIISESVVLDLYNRKIENQKKRDLL